MFDNHIGERMRKLRTEKGLTQAQLAKDLNMTQDSISRLESGARSFDGSTIYEIAKYFNVSADYLLGLSNTPSTNVKVKEVCNYTGLDQEAVKILRDKTLGDEMHKKIVNYLLCDTDTLDALIEYYDSILIKFFTESDYYYLWDLSIERKIPTSAETESAKKISYADLLDKLPLSRNRFYQNIEIDPAQTAVIIAKRYIDISRARFESRYHYLHEKIEDENSAQDNLNLRTQLIDEIEQGRAPIDIDRYTMRERFEVVRQATKESLNDMQKK